MASNPDEKIQGGFLGWVDARFPLSQMWNDHLAKYYAPKNFNFWYFFGSLALLVLVIQIVTGIFLTMFYKPDAELAFSSVEYIMRDVEWGWLIRYMHSTGASMFFVVVYLHMFRALLYGSYKKPRELIWIFGMLIYVVLMAEAFAGYLLPWGQMSYWGAQVIVNLFQTIPYIGPELVTWIRGDFLLSDATLNRFFALHVVALPLVLILLVAAHIIALHEVGSNNPDGVEIKAHKDENGLPKDGIPFHPYYTVKDIVGVGVFLIVFFAIVFFAPEGGGYFLKADNFIPSDPLVTPDLIPPVWYFTSMYSVLRSIPDPFLGVVAMGAAVVILFVIPWLDRNPVKSMRYRSFAAKFNLAVFVVAFVILGWLGLQQATTAVSDMSLRFAQVYFLFFFLLWFLSRERSAGFSILAFLVLVAIYTFYDVVRFDPDEASLIMWGWLIPTVYLFVTMVAPVFARGLGRDRAVPQRVTS
ncbi:MULTISPECIES: cytochrome b [Thioalkalivibrio]|uniref:Cytochrome b n=1 Tax=Thioalkalivibrio halophilus TaxID=252474 RepID=A0A1V2ZVM8_9GAMM|nr:MULTISPECIES: cytochrome b N-terminal domain-containing protein [Thioalkalivibrio]OOC09192.1 cytochrome b [Thioalkalivibrio halophilus]